MLRGTCDIKHGTQPGPYKSPQYMPSWNRVHANASHREVRGETEESYDARLFVDRARPRLSCVSHSDSMYISERPFCRRSCAYVPWTVVIWSPPPQSPTPPRRRLDAAGGGSGRGKSSSGSTPALGKLVRSSFAMFRMSYRTRITRCHIRCRI